jgi:hypothetical protein
VKNAIDFLPPWRKKDEIPRNPVGDSLPDGKNPAHSSCVSGRSGIVRAIR